jgi:hypothetical protein
MYEDFSSTVIIDILLREVNMPVFYSAWLVSVITMVITAPISVLGPVAVGRSPWWRTTFTSSTTLSKCFGT